jgi:hypothetical protein
MTSREEGAPRQSLWHELLSRKIARRSLLSATAAASADAEGARAAIDDFYGWAAGQGFVAPDHLAL